MDIANARFKLQSVDSGTNVSSAEDLLAQAESAFKNKDWDDASSLANKCVVKVNDTLALHNQAKKSIDAAKSSMKSAKSSGVIVSSAENELKKAVTSLSIGDYIKADNIAKGVTHSMRKLTKKLNSYSKLWERRTRYMVKNMAVTNDVSRVIAGSEDDKVYVFDADGNRLWDYWIGYSIESAAVTSDGSRIVVGSRYLKVFDADGNKLWEYKTEEGYSITAAVTPDGSRIVSGSNNGKLCVFDADGNKLWEYKTDWKI